MMRSGSEVEVVDHIPYLLFVLSKAMMGSYIVCHKHAYVFDMVPAGRIPLYRRVVSRLLKSWDD